MSSLTTFILEGVPDNHILVLLAGENLRKIDFRAHLNGRKRHKKMAYFIKFLQKNDDFYKTRQWIFDDL